MVPVPLAETINVAVWPTLTVRLAGGPAIDGGAITARATLCETTPLALAVMLPVPSPIPVARPAALMVATPGVSEAHVVEVVRSCVELSV
jgi:hypothetical protein